MSSRHLEFLFRPRAIVIIGGKQEEHFNAGTGLGDGENVQSGLAVQLFRNIERAGFRGPVMHVAAADPSSGHSEILADWNGIDHLPTVPELALLCDDIDAGSLPRLIDALGRRGTRAAVLFSSHASSAAGVRKSIDMSAVLAAARVHRLRILGPDSIGLIAPRLGLHASTVPTSTPLMTSSSASALQGKLAFVSQSGALASAVFSWAEMRGIGFSEFVTVGTEADIDIADLLDFLVRDPQTHAILLYVEQIRHARKFLSAARAAARGKPVIILKAGRAPDAESATASHAGVLTGTDDAADAAIRRAGMLRVHTIAELFGAVQLLTLARHTDSERLRIIGNGAGPCLLATDALMAASGRIAGSRDGRKPAMEGVAGDRADAINLGHAATPDDYAAAIERLFHREARSSDTDGPNPYRIRNDDAILVLHAPSASASTAEVAARIVPALAASGRTVLCCWLGGSDAADARRLSTEAGLPSYGLPEDAVDAFLQMVEYRRNQALLMQVPPSVHCDAMPERAAARARIDSALAAGRTRLTEPEAKSLLAAYGIPVVPTRFAADVGAVVAAAEAIGFPVALKIVASGVVHKSDVGGVVLDLGDAAALVDAANAMQERVACRMPEAVIDGFSVQAMARRGAGHELIVGMATDPVFGPVILFGQGGVAVEVMDDKAIGLPPLNMVLARDMVSRTRVARLLAGYRNFPAADIDAICHTLVQVAYLVSDLPEVVELDINPLLADGGGVIALDAHVLLARPSAAGRDRLAIRAYPQELERWIDWQDTHVLLRPIRPEDGRAHLRFVHALDPDDVRYRMFVAMRRLPPAQLARFTQIDYDREMAFIATRAPGRKRDYTDGPWETLGVARVVIDAATNEAEFAIIVRSDLKGHGLGSILMQLLVDYCRSRGVDAIVGEALSDNIGLRKLVRRFGFKIDSFGDHGTRGLRLSLQEATALPSGNPA